MLKLLVIIVTAALASGCQTAEYGLTTSSTPVAVTGPAASAIAGDLASRLAEQIGPAGTTTLKMKKDSSDFAAALEAALKGWGYTVFTDGNVGKGVKPFEIAYSVDGLDGQVLAQLSTPSIVLGRAYAATAAGATPTSPLSIIQRN
ncbi:conjugal transfer protein TrbH (plasmid) [Rhizobium sp. NXC14]|uniref:conjugal transfer protein TrbH n=1 Tax=Rhizobium sp. NXC14 TaxID=1981173 RepID=UPI000A20AF2F|nr:conjugal transfer protein TrbH [Rhizobium sp. NXC14]ARO32812.1 conjugal transfer protein TrbH [Rhizobium sp. NXC14]